MAWGVATTTTRGAQASSAAGTVLSIAPGSASLNSGDVAFVFIASDNAVSGDSQTSLVTNVTDTVGNTFSKVCEYTNGQAGSNSGATVSVWRSTLTSAISSANDVVSVTFGSTVTSKGGVLAGFTKTAGNIVSVRTFVTNSTDGATPATMTLSGLGSAEYLWLHAIAYEGPNSASIAGSANYSSLTGGSFSWLVGTSGGSAAGNMAVAAEYRINTATTNTVKINATAADIAQVFIALREKANEALAGVATTTFGAGASNLKGTGVLAGSSTLAFGHGSSTLGYGLSEIAGAAAVTITPASTLLGVTASASGTDITVTVTTTDISAGVFGLEYGIGNTYDYTDSVNVVGQVANQSITIGALDGILQGYPWSLRPYYNLDPLDPISTRVYLSEIVVLTEPQPFAICSVVFGAGNSTLLGAGALAGSATCVFGSGASTLGSSSLELTGVATVTFTPSSKLLEVVATSSGNDITITASPTIDLTSGVYGVEYGIGSTFEYTDSVNVVGAASFQTITIGALDGIVLGNDYSLRAYYNLDPLDPISTRVYLAEVVVNVSDDTTAVCNINFTAAATLLGAGALAGAATFTVTGTGTTVDVPRSPRPGDGIYKPTGLGFPRKKARKELEDRIQDSREIEAEIAAQLAREFLEENESLKPIEQMSMEEIASEIGLRLQQQMEREAQIEAEDDETFLILMAMTL